MARLLDIRVSPPRDALDRFEAAWNRVAEGGPVRAWRILSLADLPTLTRVLSPARWELLNNLRKQGGCSVYELARRLGRNYKNVHGDVAALAELGLVERTDEGVVVPWDALRAELRLL